MTFGLGTLQRSNPGARGIGHLTQNPRCIRLGVLVAHGVSPTQVSKDVFGVASAEGQSPFAIQKGNHFDARMSENHGALLLQLYQERGVLDLHASRSVNLGELHPKASPESLQAREQKTQYFLQQKRMGSTQAPHLLLKPRLAIEVGRQIFVIEPDYLVASDKDDFYRIGEMKSYSDRHGQTDSTKLKSACLQSAVGAVALHQFILKQGETIELPQHADLVLVWPNSMKPSLRSLRIEGEIEALKNVLYRLPKVTEQAAEDINKEASLDDPEVIRSLPNCYNGVCREFCGMANVCRREARDKDCPSVLGKTVQKELVSNRSIRQILALVEGRESPANAEEAAFVAQLKEAWTHYQKAVKS